jgi:phosphoglycolate phosphatase
MRWRGLLWDKDGTLLNTFSFWVELERRLALALARRFLPESPGAVYADRVLHALGVSEGRVDAHGVLASGTEASILETFYRAMGNEAPHHDEFEREARYQLKTLLAHPPDPARIPGIHEVLERARALNLVQGVATADTASNAVRDLRRSGIDEFFSFVASSDSLHVKPNPWPVEAFAFEAGLAVGEILVIGDTPTDQAMAAAAGADFVGVLWGTGRQIDFGAARVVTSPQELADLWVADLTER